MEKDQHTITESSVQKDAAAKITMQTIADALNVSRVTVSKAFNQKAGVSDALQKQILEKAIELGYPKLPYQRKQAGWQNLKQPDPQQPVYADMKQNPNHIPSQTVSLVVSRPDSALFWTGIIHRMAQELSSCHMNLMYTYVPSVYSGSFFLPPALADGSVQGIVTINVYDPEILGMVNRLSLPKVFLDTVPSLPESRLKGDLILIEGFDTVYRITEHLIQGGGRRIGFLGDIHYARTNMERYNGYLACMDKYSLPVNPKYCLTGNIGIFSYHRELTAYLDSLTDWPDAFVCVSDYVAHFVQQYMDDHPGHAPHKVMLSGFDHTGEYANVADILTADVPTGLLGKRLAMQLSYRARHPQAPYELTFIRPAIWNAKAAGFSIR